MGFAFSGLRVWKFDVHGVNRRRATQTSALGCCLETRSFLDELRREKERPVAASRIVIPYKTTAGMARREFTVYRTHHGPVIRDENGKWVSVKLMQEPVKALMQSYTRTKARDSETLSARPISLKVRPS